MAPQKPEFNDLEKLGNRIYDRDFPDISNFPKPVLPKTDATGERRWQGTEEMFTDSTASAKQPGRTFPFKGIFIGTLVFFLICLGIAGIVIYLGANTVTAKNVSITFLGPVTIAAGTSLDFSVVIKNDNPTPIDNITLYLSYPAGTTEATDTSAVLSHEAITLDTLAPGASETHDVRAVLYGAEHAAEEISATVQYSLANDNAVFQKQKTYNLEISSAPLVVSINAPSQTPTGAPVEFTLTLGANSSNPPQNVLLTAQYPFGFQFASSTPAPTYDNSEWLFPTIAASSTQTITITGYLQGQENDQQTIRFLAGTQSQNDPKKLDIIYLAENQTLVIQRSPIALNLSLNNDSTTNPVIQPGSISGTLIVTNNLPVSLLNTQATIQFGGNALDPTSVNPSESGIYRQTDETITWDRLSVPDLGQLNPGQQVSLDFSFNTLPANQLAALQNGSINLSTSVSGQEFGAASDAAPVVSTSNTSARLSSAVGLLAHAVYSVGPFGNTGPVPPKVDTPTTYTVLWTLTNSSNTVSGGAVTAVLPTYVHWLSNVSPSTAAISFDGTTNTITWKPGDLPAGGASPVASVAFQIQVEPMINQVGTTPDILDNINFAGTDVFVDVPVSASANSLTTAISSDPTYGGQTGYVQK